MDTPEPPTDDIFLPCGRLRTDLLSEPATEACREAVRYTRATRWESVRSPHLFMGLLHAADPGVVAWAKRLGSDARSLLEQFEVIFMQEDGEESYISLHREFLSNNVIHLLREAHKRARENRRTRITPMDLLIAVLGLPSSVVADCFQPIGYNAAKLTEIAVLAEQTCQPR